MRTPRHSWYVAIVMIVALFSGCASAPLADSGMEGIDAPPEATIFSIQNLHTSGRDMVIYLDPQGRGERQTLGVVPTGQTGSFVQAVERGRYVLLATHSLGEFSSEEINIGAPSTISWDLGTGRVITRRR